MYGFAHSLSDQISQEASGHSGVSCNESISPVTFALTRGPVITKYVSLVVATSPVQTETYHRCGHPRRSTRRVELASRSDAARKGKASLARCRRMQKSEGHGRSRGSFSWKHSRGDKLCADEVSFYSLRLRLMAYSMRSHREYRERRQANALSPQKVRKNSSVSPEFGAMNRLGRYSQKVIFLAYLS